MAKIEGVRELEVYKMAFEAAMRIFRLTKNFPAEERFSLTDQIRRASRSVCTNLSEGWRKRRYKAVFVNKLSDAMQEASETQTVRLSVRLSSRRSLTTKPGLSSPWLAATLTSPPSTSFFRHTRISWAS
jgi:four helix bundle protein